MRKIVQPSSVRNNVFLENPLFFISVDKASKDTSGRSCEYNFFIENIELIKPLGSVFFAFLQYFNKYIMKIDINKGYPCEF